MIEMRLTPIPFKEDTVLTYVKNSLIYGNLEKDIKETCDVLRYLETDAFKMTYNEYTRQERQMVIAKFTLLLKALLKIKEQAGFSRSYIESKSVEDICRLSIS